MELRQLRYFVKVIELGSMGRAAADLGVATSALSRQISGLEGELRTRLLRRMSSGIVPTPAGMAFLRQAQLTLRHADAAIEAAQEERLTGAVSVGFLPSTASVVALPFLEAMTVRYPSIRVRLAEALTTNLSNQLSTRQLDLAIHVDSRSERRWSAEHLIDERLFLVGLPSVEGMPADDRVSIQKLHNVPLVLPGDSNGLRAFMNQAFERVGMTPHPILEIDGLSTLMQAVLQGRVATIQPSAGSARYTTQGLRLVEIDDAFTFRRNYLASLSNVELSPAGLAARVVLKDVVIQLVREGSWKGVCLAEHLERLPGVCDSDAADG